MDYSAWQASIRATIRWIAASRRRGSRGRARRGKRFRKSQRRLPGRLGADKTSSTLESVEVRDTANFGLGAVGGYKYNSRWPPPPQKADCSATRVRGHYNHRAKGMSTFFCRVRFSRKSRRAARKSFIQAERSVGFSVACSRNRRKRQTAENYNDTVARGWESKSVEAQQAEASDKSARRRPAMSANEAARWREKESLRLARQRVLQQLGGSQNPRHRKLLEDALADLEEKLEQ